MSCTSTKNSLMRLKDTRDKYSDISNAGCVDASGIFVLCILLSVEIVNSVSRVKVSSYVSILRNYHEFVGGL